jgi:hypothetical protein
MKNNPPVILQAKYTGALTFETSFEIGKWFKWKVYRNEKTAFEAKQNLERKFSFLEFQIKAIA